VHLESIAFATQLGSPFPLQLAIACASSSNRSVGQRQCLSDKIHVK
jgi:hypothetical protein